MAHTHRLTVRFDEVDYARVVYFPRILEYCHRVFEAFYTTKRHGMGIGLTVSRSIVESHGGRLWAEPNPSGGAKFYVVLPVINAWQGGEAAAMHATTSL